MRASASVDRVTGTPASHAAGTWPRTSRLLPWGLAAWLVMLFVVPFDAMTLPVSLPVDSKLDRFAILLLAGGWLLALLAADASNRPRPRRSWVTFAFVAWMLVVVVNVGATAALQARLGGLSGPLKSFSLLLSFFALYTVVATTIRRAEIRPLISLAMGLACITAIGLIVEFRTGNNYFFEIARKLPVVQVGAPTLAKTGARIAVAGPTGSPLAAVTLLSLMMAFSVTRAIDAVKPSARWMYWGITFVYVAGALSTQRKSLIIVPAVALIVLAFYRPGQIFALKRLPLLVLLVASLQVVTPGGVSGLRYQLSFKGQDNSTVGRTEDYAVLTPDLERRPLIGRGYGTFSADVYRFIDNQYLGLFVTTGLIGLIAYAALFFTSIGTLHRIARSRGPDATLAAAFIAALSGFLVCNFLYDTLAFRHVPYLVFIILGLGTILRSPDDGTSPPLDRAQRGRLTGP